jgi:hypothetical protein
VLVSTDENAGEPIAPWREAEPSVVAAVMDKKYQALQEQVEWMKKEMESLMSTGGGRSSSGGGRRKVDRQMSFEEKRKLSVNIGNLPQDKVGRVVQIIRQKMPQLASGEVLAAPCVCVRARARACVCVCVWPLAQPSLIS